LFFAPIVVSGMHFHPLREKLVRIDRPFICLDPPFDSHGADYRSTQAEVKD